MSAIVDCSCSYGCGYVKYGAAILAVAATIVAGWRLAGPRQHYRCSSHRLRLLQLAWQCRHLSSIILYILQWQLLQPGLRCTARASSSIIFQFSLLQLGLYTVTVLTALRHPYNGSRTRTVGA